MNSIDKDNWFKSYQCFDNEYKDMWWENANQPDQHEYSDNYFHSSAIDYDEPCDHVGININGKWYCKECELEIEPTNKGWKIV